MLILVEEHLKNLDTTIEYCTPLFTIKNDLTLSRILLKMQKKICKGSDKRIFIILEDCFLYPELFISAWGYSPSLWS